jgi:hypothetical protein
LPRSTPFSSSCLRCGRPRRALANELAWHAISGRNARCRNVMLVQRLMSSLTGATSADVLESIPSQMSIVTVVIAAGFVIDREGQVAAGQAASVVERA